MRLISNLYPCVKELITSFSKRRFSHLKVVQSREYMQRAARPGTCPHFFKPHIQETSRVIYFVYSQAWKIIHALSISHAIS